MVKKPRLGVVRKCWNKKNSFWLHSIRGLGFFCHDPTTTCNPFGDLVVTILKTNAVQRVWEMFGALIGWAGLEWSFDQLNHCTDILSSGYFVFSGWDEFLINIIHIVAYFDGNVFFYFYCSLPQWFAWTSHVKLHHSIAKKKKCLLSIVLLLILWDACSFKLLCVMLGGVFWKDIVR